MSGRSLKVNLVANTSQFKSAMAQTSNQMKLINSEFKSAAAETDKYGNKLDATGAKKKQLNGIIEQYRLRIKAIKDEQKHWTNELQKGNITETEHAQKQQELARRLNNTEAEMKKYEGQLKRINAEGKATTRTYAEFDKQFRQVGTTMRNVGAQVGITAGIGFMAMKRVMGDVINEAKSFEAGMSKVKAISGATADEMAAMEAQALELNKTTVFTAEQAAAGMEKLALAGWKSADIMSAMPGMLDLAAAGALELATAADITSDTMQAFNLSADKAGHAADVFAYAQANANTNVEQMGEAMKYLAPTANSLGWTLEEASAVIMKLADNGLKGSMATQAFGSSLVRLSAPTPKAAKLINKLGMEFFDAEGKMKTMPEVVAEMEKGLKGMSEEQKAATMDVLVGKNAFKQWQIVLKEGSDSLRALTTDLENSDGAAKDMADTMLDNAQGAIVRMQSAISGLKIEIGNRLLPILTDAANYISGLAAKLGEMDDETLTTIAHTGLLVTAVLGVTTAVAGLVAGIGAFMAFAGPVGLAIVGGTALLGGLAAAIYKNKLETDKAKEVNLELAESLATKSNELEKSAEAFDRLSEKAEISNKELALLNDLNIRISRSSNPEEIEKLQKQYERLAEKSGLSKEELEELFKANADIIDQSPNVEKSVSEQGNAFVENTEKVKAYIETLRQQSEIQLNAQRVAMLEREREIQQDIIDQTNELEANEKRLLDLTQNSNLTKEEINDRIAEINEQVRTVNMSEEEGNALLNERRDLHAILNGKHAETIENLIDEQAGIRENINASQEQLDKLDLVNEQLANVKLSHVGINEEGREGIIVLEETIAKNVETLSLLDETLEKNGSLTEEEQKQYDELIKKNTELLKTQSYLDEELNLYGSLNSLVESQKHNLSEATNERIKSLETTHEIDVAEGNIVSQLQEKQDKLAEERAQLEQNLETQGANKEEINKQIEAIDKKLSIGDEVLLQMLKELDLLDLVKDGLLLNSKELQAYLETLGYSTQEAAELARVLSEETIDGLNSKEDEARQAGKDKGDAHKEGLESTRGDNEKAGEDISTSTDIKLNEKKETAEQAGIEKGTAHQFGLESTFSANSVTAELLSASVSKILGSTTDGGGGEKSGTEFHTNLEGQKGNAQTAGTNVATSGRDGLASVKTTQTGTDFVAGFANSISSASSSGSGSVWTAAWNLGKNALAALKKSIASASPSKLTKEEGTNFTDGFSIAINDGMGDAIKNVNALGVNAVKELADSIKSTSGVTKASTEQLRKQTKKVTDDSAKEIKAITSKSNTEIKKIEKRAQEDINLIHAKAKKAKRKLTQSEVVRIRRIEEDSANKIKKLNEKSAKDIEKIEKDKSKKLDEIRAKEFQNSKDWIERRKEFHGLSLRGELSAWERVQNRYEAGTKQRIEAEKNVLRVKQEIQSELLGLNDEYLNKMQAVNNEYDQILNQRIDLIRNAFGTFDEVGEKEHVIGSTLIDNLQGQVDYLKDWSSNLRTLAQRGIDDGLLAELQTMGPRAASEISALVQLTEDELATFEELWKEKTELATGEAIVQLEGLKEEAEVQLEELQKEWISKIEEVRYGTKGELGKMPTDLNIIGNQAISGMINGMEAMRGPLMAKARSLANAVRAEMQRVLDINSPSRVMRNDVGVQIPAGVGEGIEANIIAVKQAMNKMKSAFRIKASEFKQDFGKLAFSLDQNKDNFKVNHEVKHTGLEDKLDKLLTLLENNLGKNNAPIPNIIIQGNEGESSARAVKRALRQYAFKL